MSFLDEPIQCNGLIADIIVSRCRELPQRRVRLLGKDIGPRRMGFDVEHDFGFQLWIVQHQRRVDGTIVMCEIDVMAHRSWKRDDQMRSARFYLRKRPRQREALRGVCFVHVLADVDCSCRGSAAGQAR